MLSWKTSLSAHEHRAVLSWKTSLSAYEHRAGYGASSGMFNLFQL